MARNKILIVEDDAILAMHLQDILNRQGYDVLETISTGERVFQAVADFQPDLVLMDIELAGEMNGITAAEQLAAVTDVPVVFLTGYSQDVLVQQAKIAAPYGYLVKPVPDRELIATIEMTFNRHQLDLELKRSEERYRSLVEQASDGIFISDSEGMILDVNPAGCSMLGFTREEIIGRDEREFMDAEDLASNPLHLIKLVSGKTILSERRLVRNDGTRFYAEISAKMLDGNNLQGIVRDVDERIRNEKALKHIHELLRYILAHNQSGVAIHDRNLNYIYVSQRYLDEYGIKENVIGKHHYEVFPDLPQKWRDVHQRVLQGEVCSEDEDVFEREDGTVEWTRWECRPWYEADGEIGGIVVYTEIITDRKRMELALQESEERYRLIEEASQDLIFSFDLRGRFTHANSNMCRQLGLNQEEVLGKTYQDLQPSADHIQDWTNLLNQTIQLDNTVILDVTLQKDNGVVQYFEVTMNPMRDWEGEKIGVAATMRDVTERKQAERERTITQNRLRSIYEISQYDAKDTQDLLDFALEAAINLTDSKIGYIYLYDEATEQFTLNSWSKDVMKECRVLEPQTIYQLDKTGIWGEAVRQRCPIIDNDFQSSSPLKKGYPEGHVLLQRFLTIPVLVDHKIVAVVGVANKNQNYDDTDMLQLSLLMDSVWKIVERKRFEEELRASAEQYKALINTSLDGFQIIDRKGQFLEVNNAYCQMIGYSREEILQMGINDFEVIETQQDTVDHILKVIEQGQDRFETRHRRKDGSIIDVEVSTTYIPSRDCFLTFFQNITERQQAQQKLKEQLDELRRWQTITLGRENRIIDLKREVNHLLEQSGQPNRYPSVEGREIAQ